MPPFFKSDDMILQTRNVVIVNLKWGSHKDKKQTVFNPNPSSLLSFFLGFHILVFNLNAV